MCNVIKVINLIKLPPNDPLPGSYNFLNHKMTKKYFFHKNNGVRIVQWHKKEKVSLKMWHNEPPLGGHHLLPSWALCNQVCTPTQCIEPVSVSVSKKWHEKEEISLRVYPMVYLCNNIPSLPGYPTSLFLPRMASSDLWNHKGNWIGHSF